MKPASFKYIKPESLEEALEVKSEYGDEIRILAGGQSLIPAMNFRVMQPSVLLDINMLDSLSYINLDSNKLRLGAMTRLMQLENDSVVSKNSPLLEEALPYIAHPQIRNRGTVGGNISHADPAAELPVVAVAMNARFCVESICGSRWIKSKKFFKGYFETDISADEIMTEIELPLFEDRTGWAFQEIARRSGDYAMAGVAVLLTLDNDNICNNARIVFLNMGEAPMDTNKAVGLLIGEVLTEELIMEVADLASQQEIDPIGGIHATANYQRHLANILTKRALKSAYSRVQKHE
ncbi:MAG TPA: hypothetical protein DCL76_06525 [Chloroflexi bacterium]|nr:hypothetical protein [Chloroflexota bacterium]|tara:strand:- start:938 stop:1816 length:879 start_codon:yes stop_codon:yes gene_type:complete